MSGGFMIPENWNLASAIVVLGLFGGAAEASHYQCHAIRFERATLPVDQEFSREFTYQTATKPVDCITLEKVRGSVCWDSNRNEIRLLSPTGRADLLESSSLRVSKTEELPNSFTLQMKTESRNN